MQFYRDHNSNKKKIELMLDIGCGSGQTAQSHCKKITACDISQEQIEQGRLQNKNYHVQFVVRQAKNTQMNDNSVTLLVVGTCTHSFDLPIFLESEKSFKTTRLHNKIHVPYVYN